MANGFDPEPMESPGGEPDAFQHLASHRGTPAVPVDQTRARADIERRWAAFMPQAAHVLASSLDFQTTVDNALRLIVPRIADWCVAYILDEESRVFRAVARHADAARDELLQQIVNRHPTDPGRPFLAATLNPPRPVLVSDLTDADLRAELADEQVLRLVRALAPTSMIAAPLVARDRVLGAVTLLTDAGSPRFEAPDLTRLVELAGLAALSIDNCRLFHAAQRELVERKRTEERLLESLSLHRATLESTADGILVVDDEGRIVAYNQRFLDMWHIPREIADLGDDRHTLSIVYEQLRDPHAFLSRIRELYAMPSVESVDVLTFKDGRIYERYSRPHRVRDRIIGRVWSFRDVTEAKWTSRREQLLAEATTLLASSLDYTDTLRAIARTAIPLLAEWCRVDLVADDGRLHVIAEATERSGAADRGVGTGPTHAIAPEGSHPSAIALRSGEPVALDEFDERTRRALVAGGGSLASREPLHSLLAVPLVARGRRIGAMAFGRFRPGFAYLPAEVVVARELARRSALAVDNARLYEAALLANQAKSDFLAVMSHELRTPLTAIMGYAELLADGVSGSINDVQHHQLERIDASAQHLLRIIEQILSFARVEAGRETVRVESIDARTDVRDVVMLIHPAATKKGLTIETRLPPAPALLHTDSGKFRQILINLLSNAVNFTEEGTVGIALTTEPGGVRVRVWDTGIGIAPDHIERIFDPFWQVEQPRTRRTGGTGLGLSVTRHLAHLLGGDIEVASRLGEGSAFTVHIPDLGTSASGDGIEGNGGDLAAPARPVEPHRRQTD
ncbi:MAG TPA: ATP-binding protein [Gemmatimonadaceae bacterium]